MYRCCLLGLRVTNGHGLIIYYNEIALIRGNSILKGLKDEIILKVTVLTSNTAPPQLTSAVCPLECRTALVRQTAMLCTHRAAQRGAAGVPALVVRRRG